MSGRLLRASVIVAFATVAWSCRGAPQDEAAAVCEDLGNLAATVALIAAPPDDATVADVRGATQKLDPTISLAERAGVVPDPDGEAFRAAQEAVLEALDGIGDDTLVVEVPQERLVPTDALVARYASVMAALGCADLDDPGSSA